MTILEKTDRDNSKNFYDCVFGIREIFWGIYEDWETLLNALNLCGSYIKRVEEIKNHLDWKYNSLLRYYFFVNLL